MENNVNENTWVVEGKRDARTVEAIRAAFVESDAGNLHVKRQLIWRTGAKRAFAYFTPTPPP